MTKKLKFFVVWDVLRDEQAVNYLYVRESKANYRRLSLLAQLPDAANGRLKVVPAVLTVTSP